MARTSLRRDQQEWGRNLGQALKAGRVACGVNVAQLAVSAEVSVDTIRSIESGRAVAPTFFTVVALARVLELGLDDLAQTALGRSS